MLSAFTFQYVSINTLIIFDWIPPENDSLHSNMFLLIPVALLIVAILRLLFTFQYVSINTYTDPYQDLIQTALHSNMFLLIRFCWVVRRIEYILYIPICFY